MRYRVLPYKQGSRSARALADALGGKVLKLEGSKFNPRHDDVIINWGRTDTGIDYQTLLNFGPIVQRASNKLLFFQHMRETNIGVCPPFWSNRNEIPENQYPIVCRTVLAGHSGAGIVIADNVGALVDANLYVKYIKKQDEYRVHLGRRGETCHLIAIQRKALNTSVANPNWLVRNHDNGFVYTRNGFQAPPDVLDKAVACLMASGLDFGAVDVIWNAKQGRAYVLEINTAPGLEGQTIIDYANFFKGE